MVVDDSDMYAMDTIVSCYKGMRWPNIIICCRKDNVTDVSLPVPVAEFPNPKYTRFNLIRK